VPFVPWMICTIVGRFVRVVHLKNFPSYLLDVRSKLFYFNYRHQWNDIISMIPALVCDILFSITLFLLMRRIHSIVALRQTVCMYSSSLLDNSLNSVIVRFWHRWWYRVSHLSHAIAPCADSIWIVVSWHRKFCLNFALVI